MRVLVEKNEVRGASLSGAQPSLCGRQQANPLLQPLAPNTLLSVSVDLSALGTSYKWNHTGFVIWLLDYFTEHNVLKFIHVVTCVRIPSFLRLDHVPLYGWTTLCLSIRLSMDCLPFYS